MTEPRAKAGLCTTCAETSFAIEAGAGGSWADNVYTSEVAGTWTVTSAYGALVDNAGLTVELFRIFVPKVWRNY